VPLFSQSRSYHHQRQRNSYRARTTFAIKLFTMPLDLYPAIIHEGDLSPDAVGDDINETVEVRQFRTWLSRNLL
jgi:hypothetical protein